MKAILVICILLISFLFSTPSIVARELSDHSGSGTASKDPDKGTISCGRSGDPGYSQCIGKQKPKHKCKPHGPYNRCRPST
ncbi:hypothetical protein I3843_03G019000 [Carya illinoinensis]|uniref:Uncharacterized protein n=1 Tax=Carya illinoinensis TaxID=32201 RepID=A0A922FH86_CARIL|nr:hypothetical protein I3760_03G015900 [Carya illinoinensis]KAG6719655.1 hypothetical protein I3842_03G017100 [Carya illinoinensis]KAG7985309.1 hypothetical protein I3843_03G019000 [Carya illinoinensis]